MYPIFLEPLCLERVTVQIADLPPSLQGTKVVQLSDLHYDGQRLSERLLAEAVEVCNQEEPDLIVLTGDYVTDDPEPMRDLVLRLKPLQARAGIFASLGNHDLYFRRSRQIVTEALTGIGIEVLWNAIAYPLGPDLAVVGLADFWSREFHPGPVFAQIPPQIPRLILSHNPDTAETLQQWRADLQLSGHTHGGQISLPDGTPFPQLLEPLRQATPKSMHRYIPLLRECAKVVKHWEWARGYHRLGDNQLYINRGLGTYFPGRIGCPPEVTAVTLIRA
ncbi:MAG: metallophosphoesterase [Spirulinaceae cyanobacterium SM2_1_0]|nr:metallophosphoesterase [Spirulinaceae cyanobacterium SM2_1_0]